MSDFSADIIKAITQQGNELIGRIKTNMANAGQTKSGQMANSLYQIVSEDGFKIVQEVRAAPFFAVVETGRRPTPDKKPSRKMIENLSQWVRYVGLPSVWAVAVSINKNGTKLWQKGGRKDIYSNEVEAYVPTLADVVAKFSADYVVHQTPEL